MPPSASSKRPLRAETAPVNAPLRVAEELALEERLGDGGAVDRHERAVGRLLLAWIAFATSSLPVPLSPVMSTVASVGAILHDAPEHLADRSRAADDVLELVALLELDREERHLAGEAAVVDRLADLDEQFLLGERLLDVVERAEAHGLDGALDGAVRGHHDDLGHRLRRLDGAQDVDAVVRAHPEIGEHDVVRAAPPRSAPSSPFCASSTS